VSIGNIGAGLNLQRRQFIKALGAAVPLMAGSGFALAGNTSAMAKESSGNLKADWPKRGNFGYKALVGPHRADAAAMVDPRPFFGLAPEATFLYGCLRDEKGEMYELCRNIPWKKRSIGSNGLFMESTAGQQALRIIPEVSQAAANSNDFVGKLEGDMAVFTSPKGVQGKPYRITYSRTRCTWFEQDVCDLKGELIGPGLQWHIPDPDIGIFYVSQLFQLTGTVRGKKVRGMIGFDQTYLRDGAILYAGQDPLTGPKQHRAWYTWATRYKDGTLDGGHFLLGHDRMGFALLTNEKEQLTLVTDVEGDIEIGPDNTFPKGLKLRFGTQEWEFLPDPKGTMPDLLGLVQPSTPQVEGRWRRIGDKREPDVWFAWGEVAPAHGLAYEKRLRY